MNLILISVTHLLLVAIKFLYAWPKGAPLNACDTLRPSPEKHGPSKVDPDQAVPFRIIPSTDRYDSGDNISVLITGGSYKGLMLQAISMFTNERVGEFIDPPPGTKLLNCSMGNAMTHDGSRDNLQGLIYTWKAPGMSAGTINFRGTVVKEKQIYWTDLISNPIAP